MGIFTSKPKASKHKEDHTGETNLYVRVKPTRYDLSTSENHPDGNAAFVKESHKLVEMNIHCTTAEKSEYALYLELPNVDTSHLVIDMSRETKDEKMREDFPLVIAIDFGTSYSGYGYQFLDEDHKDRMTISFPQEFNGGKPNLLSHKTSTCILINKNLEVASFGFEAEEK